jgi:hypothetical protein
MTITLQLLNPTGPLGTSRFEASSSANVGLTACFNGHWYGDPYGLRLYYGSAQGSVQEVYWNFGDTAWSKGYTFPDSNPNGGCECTVRGSSITNLWLLNEVGELEQRWFDFNLSANSTVHSAGTWIKRNYTLAPQLPSTFNQHEYEFTTPPRTDLRTNPPQHFRCSHQLRLYEKRPRPSPQQHSHRTRRHRRGREHDLARLLPGRQPRHRGHGRYKIQQRRPQYHRGRAGNPRSFPGRCGWRKECVGLC